MDRGRFPERYCPRVEGSGAVVLPQQLYVCAECGERVIYNPRLDDPPDLRLVCTVCLVGGAYDQR